METTAQPQLPSSELKQIQKKGKKVQNIKHHTTKEKVDLKKKKFDLKNPNNLSECSKPPPPFSSLDLVIG